MRGRFTASALSVCAALALPGAIATAWSAPDLTGKTVTMVIGFAPGGGNDAWGRTVARHIGKHLPGKPGVVAENRPGAGSFIATNYIYNAAPKDGTVIGIIARDAALGPLTGAVGAQFDPLKLTWLGSPSTETNVCIAMADAKVKNVDDLMKTELLIGDPGPGTGAHTYPRALNQILGTKFKLISGYESSSAVFLAMERGEVEGFCESLDSVTGKRSDWISSGKIRIVLQGGLEPAPEIKDIPFAIDLAKTEDERKLLRFLYAGQAIGRPFIAPPGLSPEVTQMLTDAFDATMKDPEFIAEAAKLKLDLAPKNGEATKKIVEELYATPKPLVERMTKMLRE